MDKILDFFITSMPDTRPANYYLGCLDGSIFIDFDNYEGEKICLKRISFDGYGCCDLGDRAIPMNQADSMTFRNLIKAEISDQLQLTVIVRKAILANRQLIWKDALSAYDLYW